MPCNKKKEQDEKKKKKNIKKEWGEAKKKKIGREERARIEREIFFFFSSFISKIYENQIVGFYWSKRQSSFTRRKLRVGTKILEFRQTP